MSHPSATYVCEMPNCPRRFQHRQVFFQRIGLGLYERPAPVCECSPDIDMRRVNKETP